jgi:hypothetical protein
VAVVGERNGLVDACVVVLAHHDRVASSIRRRAPTPREGNEPKPGLKNFQNVGDVPKHTAGL